MKNNIYVSTTFIKDNQSFSVALKLLKSLNITNIEIGSNHIHEKKKLDLKKYKCNFLIHNYFPVPEKKLIINIASQNERIRKSSISHIKKSIYFSKKNKAKLYTFHPGFISDPESTSSNKKNYDFIWKKKLKINSNKKAWNNMIKSLKEIIIYSNKIKFPICIETQGSIKQKDKLLMQRPNEFKKLFKLLKNYKIGINLNLAHLNLSSKAFNFNKERFISLIKDRIVAFEVSHNYGKIDNHLPLKLNTWYLKILNKNIFKKIPIILEFRNSSLRDIRNSCSMF